jgi:VanZ family protein
VVAVVSGYVLFDPRPAGASAVPHGVDKLVHATLFALLAATARWRFGARAAVLAAVVAYAATSELVQAVLLPTRTGDVLDLVADTAGALVAWLLVTRAVGTRRS